MRSLYFSLLRKSFAAWKGFLCVLGVPAPVTARTSLRFFAPSRLRGERRTLSYSFFSRFSRNCMASRMICTAPGLKSKTSSETQREYFKPARV